MDEQTILKKALAQPNPDARARWLDKACGQDDELRQRIQFLLRQHEQVGSYFELPAPGIEETVVRDSAEGNANENQDSNTSGDAGVSRTADQLEADNGPQGGLFDTLNRVPRVALRESETQEPDPVQGTSSPNIPNDIGPRYQIQGEIARGGMGAIIKGRDTDLGRELAIKVLLDSHRSQPAVIQRFIEEAQIGGQLQHPGIAPIYELGQFPDKRPFFTMKLIKGRTLSKLLSERDAPSDDRGRFLGIFEQVCQTMAYAHSRGVIHRDLKPSNIMVGAFGEVQVMDWGLAKVLQAGGLADEKKSYSQSSKTSVIRTLRGGVGSDSPAAFGSDGTETEMGTVMGTPAYMPPEQALGEIDQLDERSDVFGLGAILCEVLTGQPPYVDRDKSQVFRLASRGKLDDCLIRLDACGADDGLIGLTKRCLAPDPVDRPKNARELAQHISEYLESVETKLRETEMAKVDAQARAEELTRRRKLWYALAGMLLVGLIGTAFAADHFRKLEKSQSELAAFNAELAKEREAERNAADVAREAAVRSQERESRLKNQAITLKHEADKERKRADVSARLAQDRAAEIRKTLYASEMQQAFAAENQGGAAQTMRALLDRWRPQEGEVDLRGWEWYYLLSRVEKAEFVLEHPGAVPSIDWSLDGRRIYTACHDGVLRAWDTDTGRLLNAIQIANYRVHTLDVSPDGQRLATLDRSGVMKIWNTADWSLNLEKAFPRSTPATLAWFSDGERLAVGTGSELQVIDTNSGESQSAIETKEGITSVAWHDDQNLLAISAGRKAIIWNPETDESQKFLQSSFSRFTDIHWNSAGDGVIIGGRNHFHEAKLEAESSTHFFKIRNELPQASSLSKKANRIVYGTFDREVRLVDMESGETTQVLQGHVGEIQDVSWSPDGSQVASSSRDGQVRIWRPKSTVKVDPIGFTWSVAWRPGKSEAAVGRWKHSGFVNFATRPKIKKLQTGGEGAEHVDWSDDGHRLAVATGNQWSIVRMGEDGSEPTVELREQSPDIGYSFVQWEPNGERVILGSPRSLKVHSTLDAKVVWDSRGFGYRASNYCRWHPKGNLFAIGDRNRLLIYNADTGSILEEWVMPSNISALSWHPSGQSLAIATDGDSGIELRAFPGGQITNEIKTAALRLHSLDWSPDGATLAFGGDEGVVRIWSSQLQRVVLSFHEAGAIRRLSWDDTGTRLAVLTGAGLEVRDASQGFFTEGSPHALQTLNQKIAANPKHELFEIQKAELLERLGDWQSAGIVWQTLLDKSSGDSWYARQALRAEIKRLLPQKAIELLETRLVNEPDSSVAARLLAELLLDRAGKDGWTVVEIEDAVSEGDAVLLTEPDGSVLAAGDNPDRDVYRITGRTGGLSQVTAVRLETIPDDRLPKHGSGRQPSNGNFHLGDFSVQTNSQDGEIADQIVFKNAWADFPDAPHASIQRTFDANRDRGWDTHPNQNQKHIAVIEFARAQATGLPFLFRFETGTSGGRVLKRNLGRFRISVTDRPNAARLERISFQLRANHSHFDDWTMLGIARSINHQPEEAAIAFGLGLDNTSGREGRLRVLTEASLDDKAMAFLVESRPNQPLVAEFVAERELKKQMHDVAIQRLSDALAIHPENKMLLRARGRAFAAARRWNKAARDLALGIGPDSRLTDDLLIRANAYRNRGKTALAVADVKRVLEITPNEYSTNVLLTDLLIQSKDWKAVVESGNRYFEVDPQGNAIWLRLAPALLLSKQNERYASFQRSVRDAIDGSKDFNELERGVKCVMLGPGGELLVDRKTLFSIEKKLGDLPKDDNQIQGMQATLALAFFRLGENQKAIHYADLGAQPGNTRKVVAMSHSILSLAQTRLGDMGSARNSLKDATETLAKMHDQNRDWHIANILRREAEVALGAQKVAPESQSQD